MHRYAQTLFGNCTTENLLAGLPFDEIPGCFLFRVKDACNKGDWKIWPKLIGAGLKETVEAHGRDDIIQVPSKRARLFDQLQVTPNGCSCRACFGGDRHCNLRASASETKATQEMNKMLMAKFNPTPEEWNENQASYYTKSFHLVLNRYYRNDCMNAHQDLSSTYHVQNPVTSLSYGRGSILTIQDSIKPAKQQTALYFQFPGDAIIMSGPFNLRFYHGVPAVDSWKQLFQSQNIVRMLPPNEFEEANRVIADVEANLRFNVTIRWHESHYQGCIYHRCR